MDNPKSELLETVEIVSEFAGTLAGKVVVRSREISDCVKNMMTAKLESKPVPSTKATESVNSHAKKKITDIEKKETTSKQAKLKKQTDRPVSSRSPQSSSRPKADLGENAVVEAQKPKRPVTKTKKSSVKSNKSTAKN